MMEYSNQFFDLNLVYNEWVVPVPPGMDTVIVECSAVEGTISNALRIEVQRSIMGQAYVDFAPAVATFTTGQTEALDVSHQRFVKVRVLVANGSAAYARLAMSFFKRVAVAASMAMAATLHTTYQNSMIGAVYPESVVISRYHAIAAGVTLEIGPDSDLEII